MADQLVQEEDKHLEMQDMNDGGDEGQDAIGDDQGEDISGMQGDEMDGQGDQEDGEGQEDIDQDGGNDVDEGQLDFEQIDMKICGDLIEKKNKLDEFFMQQNLDGQIQVRIEQLAVCKILVNIHRKDLFILVRAYT